MNKIDDYKSVCIEDFYDYKVGDIVNIRKVSYYDVLYRIYIDDIIVYQGEGKSDMIPDDETIYFTPLAEFRENQIKDILDDE